MHWDCLCAGWYHADAVELEESRILALLGFKCCKCRRIRSPVCPHADQTDNVKPLKEGTVKPGLKASSGQPIDGEPTSLVDPAKEEHVCIEGDDPSSISSLSRVQHDPEQTSEVEFEWNSASFPGLRSHKPSEMRHMKQENDQPVDSSTPLVDASLLPVDESSSYCVEQDASENVKDGIMVNYDTPNHEDMEFETHTYFSSTELVQTHAGSKQLDGGDTSGPMIENVENPFKISQGGNPETYEIGINWPKDTDSSPKAVQVVPCRICSGTEPSPDRSCEICGLWMHSGCSPVAEEPSGQSGWRCFNCREWQ